MTKIQNIVFDLGHVLVDLDFSLLQSYFSNCFPDGAISQDRIVELINYRDYERGRISDNEFVGNIVQILSGRYSADEVTNAWCSIFRPHIEMLSLRDNLLTNGYTVYYLSNTNGLHAPVLLRDYQFDRIGHGYVFSHEVKSAKPEPEIYRHLASRYNLEPELTVLIDDLPANVEAARNIIGWRAIQHRDYLDTARELKKSGVDI